MSQKQPFFKRQAARPLSLNRLAALKRKKEMIFAAAAFAAAALALALFSNGQGVLLRRFFRASGVGLANASLPVSALARGVPQWPAPSAVTDTESLDLIQGNPSARQWLHWRGYVAGQRVAGFLDPAQAGRQLVSVALSLPAPKSGLSVVVPDAVAEALSSTSQPQTPRARREGRRRRGRFDRRWHVGISPCVGLECTLRNLSDARLLTAGHDPCLAIQGCAAEEAAADVSAVYDGSLPDARTSVAAFDQSAPKLSLNAAPNLDRQDDAAAAQAAQSLARMP